MSYVDNYVAHPWKIIIGQIKEKKARPALFSEK